MEWENLAIWKPHPRPMPAMIWKKIHLKVEEFGDRVARRPVPMEFMAPLAIAQGR